MNDEVRIDTEPDDDQVLLLEALEENSATLGEIYRGILHALHSAGFPNQSRVLAYQARELMELAPRVMSTYGATLPAKPPTFDILKRQLNEEFETLSRKLELTPLDCHSGQLECHTFLGFIEEWLLLAEQARPSYRKLVQSQVSRLEPSYSRPDAKMLELAARSWGALKDAFNGILHTRTQVEFADVRSRVLELEDFLLHRIRPRPFEDQAKLDAFLAQPPEILDETQIGLLLQLIGALVVNYRYFFRHLVSPEWIGFLEERDFFNHPPESLKIDDQIYDPDWPELLYLERCAATAPDDVGRIARNVSRLEPENPRVHEVLINISTRLLIETSPHGRKVLNSELNWINNQQQLHLQLPTVLLEAAAAAAETVPGLALRVARAVLSLDVSKTVQEQRTKENWHRLGTWDSREILEQLVKNLLPVLPPAAQIDLLVHLCEHLELVGGNEFESDDPHLTDAVFQMWRPAIEDCEQNDPNSISNWAIEAVRDAADAIVPTLGGQVLEALEQHDSLTLMRISLHLRRKYRELDPEGTAKLASSPDVIGSEVLRHELFLLLREQFTSFPEQLQTAYLECVDNLDTAREKYLCLWPIRHALPSRLLSKYEQYEDEFGELDHADLLAYHGVEWIGPTSPLSITEMMELEIPELVTQLNQWVFTPGGWRVPEPEGLARELSAYARQDAGRISAEALALTNLKRPTYVRGIVQGLANAVKEGKGISWQPVLNFCKWAVEQERGEGPEGNGLDEFDRTWGPARKQIAWLLLRGTERSIAEIPFELKDSAWGILRELIEDPDPTMNEESDRSQNMDPSTIAINTVRGVTLGALFSFASWVTRHNPREEKTWDRFGLGAMAVMLEGLLSNDNAPSVRSVFGRWLFHLFWLDQAWTEQNVDRIFPLEKPGIWAAAWESYLMFSSALCLEFLPLLRQSYKHALESIGIERPGVTRPASVDERLGNHLVLFFREDVLKCEDALFQEFFKKADAKLLHKVMTGAVRQVQEISEERRTKAIALLQSLWEWRSEDSIDEESGDQHELSSFAWWFLKDEFDADWRLEHLKRIQRKNIKLELDGRVLETLASLTSNHLGEVLECLEAIVRNPNAKHWGIYDDRVKEILRTGLATGDTELHDKAESMVHYIGSLGYLDFRTLLDGIDTDGLVKEEPIE